MAPKNHAQCTHLTMTRLYTSDFRCGVCFRLSTTGWIYRCSQDRELIMEDEAERGEVNKMDAICDLFPPTSTPRMRGPAARADPYSFLGEISDDALKTYSPAQVALILKQRAHMLDVVNSPESSSSDDNYYYRYTDTNASPRNSPSPPKDRIAASKPWLAQNDTDCQFKCCHLCRPTLSERSFLSLNGIVNDDVPATAIYGFGFHLHGRKRPVALVKHVKNLGLRTPPPVSPEALLIDPNQARFLYLNAQMLADQHAQAQVQAQVVHGLGLTPQDITQAPRMLPPLPTVLPTASPLSQLAQSLASLPLVKSSHDSTIPYSPNTSIRAPPGFTSPATTQTSASIALTNNLLSPTPKKLSTANGTTCISPARSILLRRLDDAGAKVAVLTPLPSQTEEEVADIAGGLTAMETSELEGGFGGMPLDVKDGVAVTEEAVEGHFADVLRQV